MELLVKRDREGAVLHSSGLGTYESVMMNVNHISWSYLLSSLGWGITYVHTISEAP